MDKGRAIALFKEKEGVGCALRIGSDRRHSKVGPVAGNVTARKVCPSLRKQMRLLNHLLINQALQNHTVIRLQVKKLNAVMMLERLRVFLVVVHEHIAHYRLRGQVGFHVVQGDAE